MLGYPSLPASRSARPRHALLPALVTASVVLAMVAHGRIAQPAGYHDFADQSVVLGVRHLADVLSNAGFALVAIWGWAVLYPRRGEDGLRAGWPGYALFLGGLLLTAFGSSFYHLAPDNARLIWDRLPIALACAGLLAGVRGDVVPGSRPAIETVALGVFGAASVAWWVYTDSLGVDDLRPYLLLQILPLALVPAWQWIYRAPALDRTAFGAAMVLYVFAKAAELADHRIADVLGFVSGHTLKHLLATAATGCVVWALTRRKPPAGVKDPSQAA